MMLSTTFDAIGTRWDIQVHDLIAEQIWQELLAVIRQRIISFDQIYSRFRPDSLVSRMAQSAGTYELPPDGYALLQFYHELYQITDGKVTPLIGQVLSDAGYDATYSLVAKPMIQPPEWQSVLSYDQHQITLERPVLLDFGAAGKGYLVDIIAKLLDNVGLQQYVINAGGDILQRSVNEIALEVGLENPFDDSEAIGIAQLVNRSLCASAGSRRAWGDFHHIINPFKLQSPDEIVATWAIADDTITADGLATALFFTTAQSLGEKFLFSYAVLTKDGQLSCSPKFPITVFEAT
jgi:thiamine biosynthesis lipoprotein